MRHRVSLNDLVDYEWSVILASAAGRRENKKLYGVVKNGIVHYEVNANGGQIENTASLEKAVDAYNNA